MEEELHSDIIKNTQIALGKYVKRPPLTEKLLKKPPFRFLHDIISSVLKSTGFFSGLFDEEELISDNVKDRESKIIYLNKIISVISATTGKSLSVKPSKIIAGQEPEKTNELLQCLALALDNNLSSDEAVKQFKESITLNASNDKKGKDTTKPARKNTDVRKVSSKGSDKSVKSDVNASNAKLRQRENTTVKKESPPKKTSLPHKGASKKVPEKIKQTNKSNSNTLLNNIAKKFDNESLQNYENADPDHVNLDNPNLTSASLNIRDDKTVTPGVNVDCNKSVNKEYSLLEQTSKIEDEYKNLPKVEENVNTDSSIVIVSEHQVSQYEFKEKSTIDYDHHESILQRKAEETESIKENSEKNNVNESAIHTHETKVTDISNTKRPLSVRPPSSRPCAPRLREKHDSIITSTENLVAGKVNIIAEKTANEEEDESTIVIIDGADSMTNIRDETYPLQISSDQHGHLVQQILDAQKEFTQAAGKTEIEWQFGAQKARDVVNQEIEQMRFNVQALSRVANPLGKLLDHIQEDVEVMRQELNQWITIYKDASKELSKQKVANEEYLLPLHARINQLDVDIADKHDKVNDVKIVIHKNSSRIDKLLTNGSVQ